MGSLIMEAADATRVPAGSALAVDRTKFSQYITDRIRNHPNIEVIEEEVSSLEEGVVTVIATGPLTSDAMANFIKDDLGCGKLHFFDAAAPITGAEAAVILQNAMDLAIQTDVSDYKDDFMCRGDWVRWISGGSAMNPKEKGLGIPVDMSLGFHSDAGVTPDDGILRRSPSSVRRKYPRRTGGPDPAAPGRRRCRLP